MWIDPHETGLYLGQCAQYCGTQHAKMLLRVYVQSKDDFDRWIQEQSQLPHPATTSTAVSEGTTHVRDHRLHQLPRRVRAQWPTGDFGPDLTHLMSRDTIAAGAAPNTPDNLRLWIRDPDAIKPGSLDAGHGAGVRKHLDACDSVSGDASLSIS
jgi:cytochrome c oxidase subunit II